MNRPLNESYSLLIEAVSRINTVMSIGKSGGKELPESNESDIDIFIYCSSTPSLESRQEVIDGLGDIATDSKLSYTEGRFWGTCDYVTVQDTEICLMYFTIDNAKAEIESILNGERLDKEDNYFYPTGRCATMLSMYALYDKNGFIADMKEKLTRYPLELAQKLISRHIGQINDAEDFGRAVTRLDVLFYHSTLEIALDHFLQVLFAMNKRFLPSRKRSLQFIHNFCVKPVDCDKKLLQVIELGAKAETIAQSYSAWESLCVELEKLCSRTV